MLWSLSLGIFAGELWAQEREPAQALSEAESPEGALAEASADRPSVLYLSCQQEAEDRFCREARAIVRRELGLREAEQPASAAFILEQLRFHTDDPVFLTMLDLFKAYGEIAWTDVDDALDAELEGLFEAKPSFDFIGEEARPTSIQGQAFSLDDKIALWATLLPFLEEHAWLSERGSRIKKLRQNRRSLRQHWPQARRDFLCERLVELEGERFVCRLRLRPEMLLSGKEDFSALSLHRLAENEERAALAAMHCSLSPALEAGASLEQSLERQALIMAMRDEELRDEGLIELLEELDLCLETSENSSESPEGCQRELTCPLQALLTLHIDNGRLPQALLLDQHLKQLSQQPLHERLVPSKACLARLSGENWRHYRESWEKNLANWQWIEKHFAPKNRKNIEKNARTWFGKIKDDYWLRRSLASLAALSLGDKTRAQSFAQGLSEKRRLQTHPLTFAYLMQIDAIAGQVYENERLLSLWRAFDLRSKHLTFLSLTPLAKLLPERERRRLLALISTQRLIQALPSSQRFIRAYLEDIFKEASPEQRIQNLAWLLSSAPSPSLERRFYALSQEYLLSLEAQQEAEALDKALLALSQVSGLAREARSLFEALRSAEGRTQLGDLGLPQLYQSCLEDLQTELPLLRSALACLPVLAEGRAPETLSEQRDNVE